MVPFILTLFVASIFFILIVASCVYNLYVFIRKKIPVHVNCWFCNENSYVCFKSKDSWVCSGCQQYNGFDENGDYNCDISNQYFDFLNPTVYCQYEKSGDLNKSNQLCTSCNYKQAEKVQLIAEFVPKNVHHYDYEVEEYIKKLEDSYQVCKKCSKVVDKAVAESKTLLLEQYLTFLRSKGLNISNLKSTDTNFNYYISTTTNSVIFVLSGIYLINLCYLLNNQNSRIYNKFYPYLLNMADNIILYFKILNETYGSMILLENIHNSLTTKYDFFFLNISSLYIPAFETISFNDKSFSLSIIVIEMLLCTYQFAVCKLRLVLIQVMLWFLSLVMYLNLVKTAWIKNEVMISDLKILLALTSFLLSMGNHVPSFHKPTVNKVLRVLPHNGVSDNQETRTNKSNQFQNSRTLWNKSSNSIDAKQNFMEFQKVDDNSKFTNISGNSISQNVPKLPIFRQSLNDNFSEANPKVDDARNKHINPFKSSCFKPISLYNDDIGDFGLSNLYLTKKRPQSYSSLSCNSLFSTREYKANKSNIFGESMQCKTPIIAPSRLEKSFIHSHVSSGKYWSQSRKHMANMNHTFPSISRTSSQSSGFESQLSGSCYNTFSCPPSRDDSVCSDFENSSVLSEPTYYSQNFFQPSQQCNSLMSQNNYIPSELSKSKFNLVRSFGSGFNSSSHFSKLHHHNSYPTTFYNRSYTNGELEHTELKL